MEVEGAITISTMTVGKVRLDPTAIRGEGNEYDPRLVIPIKIELYQQPSEHQIAIIRLSASLHFSEAVGQNNQFTSTIHYDTTYNMPIRSVNYGTSESTPELHFNLTHAQLKALENMRHEPGKTLYLRIQPLIVQNEYDEKPTYNRNATTGQAVSIVDDWSRLTGISSRIAVFWISAIGMLRLNLAEMKWAEQIFPGMGYDNFRLIEVKLPVSDVVVPGEAVDYFKEAKMAYDRGDHTGCLEKCRYALDEVEKHLSPHPQGHALGTAITSVLGWSSTPDLTEQAKFLNSAWVGLYSLANAAHHTPSRKSLLPTDAHMVLISLAAMLEYLAQLE